MTEYKESDLEFDVEQYVSGNSDFSLHGFYHYLKEKFTEKRVCERCLSLNIKEEETDFYVCRDCGYFPETPQPKGDGE